jgi:hypothetical protein
MKPDLTPEEVRSAFLYDAASGKFFLRESGAEVGTTDLAGYAKIGFRGTQYLTHRLAWLYVYGRWPSIIDHIDGDPSNNALANLREVTHSQNLANAPAFPSSRTGIRGVHYHPRAKKYRVQLTRGWKCHHGGYFDTIEEAALAAERLSIELSGIECPNRSGTSTKRSRMAAARQTS